MTIWHCGDEDHTEQRRSPAHQSLIYDCFPFFNELDVLEIRLNVLSEVIDRFVLVEARQTFQRGAKPLYYAENKQRFAAFTDRIEHIVVDEFPAEVAGDFGCEYWQRNAIQRGLRDAEPGDTILISDVDEIPRPECVAASANRGGVAVFRQLMFSYFLNCVHLRDDGTPRPIWNGTVAYRHDAHAAPPQRYADLRFLRGGQGDPLSARLRAKIRRVRRLGQLEGQARFIEDAGWHFTYQGGIEAIIAKLEAYSHVEYNTDDFKSRAAILKAIEEKRDLFGRGGRYDVVPVDGSFPAWLRENATARYGHLLAAASDSSRKPVRTPRA